MRSEWRISSTFTGVVARHEVPHLAVAFDVALQTALVPYASPLCLFEYLALGKAIAAPDQPNHHEVLRAGVDALLYRPDDPGDLERTIEKLVGDAESAEPPWRRRQGDNCGAWFHVASERREGCRGDQGAVTWCCARSQLRALVALTSRAPSGAAPSPGSPPQSYFLATFLRTTAPAPTRLRDPIVTSPRMVAFAPT